MSDILYAAALAFSSAKKYDYIYTLGKSEDIKKRKTGILNCAFFRHLHPAMI